MRINFARSKSIKRLAALAVVAFSLFQLPAGSESSAQSNETTVAGETALVGLASGDMLRFTAFNPAKTESGGPNEPISLQLKLYDSRGDVIAESRQIEILPGEFRSIDFKHADLHRAGEPGTGRLQVRLTVLLKRLANPHLPPASLEIMDEYAASLEVMDSHGGTDSIWLDLSFPVRKASKVHGSKLGTPVQ
jgi:hypothetical protein